LKEPFFNRLKAEKDLKHLLALTTSELNLVGRLQVSDVAFKELIKTPLQPLVNSSWIFLQIEGFDDYQICLYNSPAHPEFNPYDIEYLRNVVRDLKAIRTGLRKQALDIKTNKKYIDITKDLDRTIFIKGGGGGPYCTISFDSECRNTQTHRISLQNLQNHFSEDLLLRIHHSFLINPKQINFSQNPIVKLEGRSYKISMIDQADNTFFLPVSKKYYDRLKTTFPEWFI
jgi:hypothetical protein